MQSDPLICIVDHSLHEIRPGIAPHGEPSQREQSPRQSHFLQGIVDGVARFDARWRAAQLLPAALFDFVQIATHQHLQVDPLRAEP